MSINSEIKCNLTQHLINFYSSSTESSCRIGTLAQLEKVAKVHLPDTIWNNQKKKAYPDLPKRNYLVACLKNNDVEEVRVFAVYTFDQIKQMENESDTGYVHSMSWRILEIAEELETQLFAQTSYKN